MALLCTGENFYSCGTIQSRGSIICLPLQNLYTYIYMYWHIYMYIYDNHIYESIWVESLKLLLYTATGENFYFCGTNRSRGPMIFLPFRKLQTSKKNYDLIQEFGILPYLELGLLWISGYACFYKKYSSALSLTMVPLSNMCIITE